MNEIAKNFHSTWDATLVARDDISNDNTSDNGTVTYLETLTHREKKDRKKEQDIQVRYETPTIGLPIGVASTRGNSRPRMEDRHIATEFDLQLNNNHWHNVQLAGVFDGHTSPHLAQYASEHIQEHLIDCLKEFSPDGLTTTGIWNALSIAIVDLSRQYAREHPDKPSGSTATMAITLNNQVWVVNTGDSRTMVIHDDNQQITQLSNCLLYTSDAADE